MRDCLLFVWGLVIWFFARGLCFMVDAFILFMSENVFLLSDMIESDKNANVSIVRYSIVSENPTLMLYFVRIRKYRTIQPNALHCPLRMCLPS